MKTSNTSQKKRTTREVDLQLGIPSDLPSGIRSVIRGSGLSYDAYVKAITSSALKDLPVWNLTDLERLLLTAKKYYLDPLEREVFMLPSGNEFAPLVVISIDGWVKIINAHPQFAGITFTESTDAKGGVPLWMECEIYRHDRLVPVRVREYFDEAQSDHTAWITHPRRMLRHKCMVQCIRIAFGLTSLYDNEESMNRLDRQRRGAKKINTSPNLRAQAIAQQLINSYELKN